MNGIFELLVRKEEKKGIQWNFFILDTIIKTLLKSVRLGQIQSFATKLSNFGCESVTFKMFDFFLAARLRGILAQVEVKLACTLMIFEIYVFTSTSFCKWSSCFKIILAKKK